MSTSRDLPFLTRVGGAVPLAFRTKLTLLLILVVSTATLLTLYFTQRAQESVNERNLRDKFQNRLGYLLGAQTTQEAQISEQCRLLAKSVRIQAALEEKVTEDLYAIARIELRNLLDDSGPTRTPRATFFRFLDPEGKMLEPPHARATPEPWEKPLLAARLGTGKQLIGYVAVPSVTDSGSVLEIVATPILDQDGELLATLVLGFPVGDLVLSSDAELKTGLWLNDQLYLPALPPAERETLSKTLGRILKTEGRPEARLNVEVQGEPCLLFYKILTPDSPFPPAYEVCLFSLSASVAQQEALRGKILGIALLVLLVGIAASHYFSASLSRPVEQLAEVSAQNAARRVEAEAEREVTEQKYRSIFENAVEGIFLLSPGGGCLSANPAMARIFGARTPEEFQRNFAADMQSLYVNSTQAAEFLRRVREENTVSNFECEMRRPDGTTLWISQNARAVRETSGALRHIEGTMEDITERRKAADALQSVNLELEKTVAELRTTQKQIIQQERLGALGQMASGIAHDFNNALMPITGFSELLLSHPEILDDKKKAAEYLETIRTAAKDGTSIVARLREFYRTNENSDVRAPVNLSQLLRQAITLTQPKWKGQARAGGIEIKIVEELTDVPAVSGDESALRETFTNLIFNAVDAMPKGGTITIRCRSVQDDVVVEIADTGTGMTEEVRQRCLEPFFTTKGENGTGLGLSMVFGIVQRHGGEIDLQTQLGHGTNFRLCFPKRKASDFIPTEDTASTLPPGALRVLLVEDEPQVREVLTAFLEIDGHRVRAARDGAEGLVRFSEETFDLVITDKAMPGLSGPQLAEQIRRQASKIPIILLSGFNSPGDSDSVDAVNVVAAKPITMPTLRAAVQKAMESA